MQVIKKSNIVIFEINDDSRKHEHSNKYGLPEYEILFFDFVKSLGYDIELKYPEHKGGLTDMVIINGVAANIGTKNASYMSHNAWTREATIRKAINRYITFTVAGTDIKVPINQEIDSLKLKKRIDVALASYHKVISHRAEVDNQNCQNTIAVAKHYISFITSQYILTHINTIKIHQGIIYFQMDFGSLSINVNGVYNFFNLYSSECRDAIELQNMFSSIKNAERITMDLLAHIEAHALPDALQQWATNAYEQRYNVQKQEYFKP